MYALNDVAPSSAQYATMRRASSTSRSAFTPGIGSPGPFRYGAVTCTLGPGVWPASIERFRFRSA